MDVSSVDIHNFHLGRMYAFDLHREGGAGYQLHQLPDVSANETVENDKKGGQRRREVREVYGMVM